MLLKNRNEDFDPLLLANYRWPKKGDRLLRPSKDRDRGVEFAKDPISRHVHIWSGYMSGGAALLEMCEKEPHERHFLIYPALHSYRHGIELAMKWIITMYGNKGVGDIEHHDLWQLWKECRKVLEATGQPDPSIDAVEIVIKDFHDLDKGALAFRYGQNKDGALIKLPDGTFDLDNVRDVMEGIAGFFEGADGFLSDLHGAMPDEW